MESNAIQIVGKVRVRPWNPEKELPLVHQPTNDRLFLGDGGFANSPRKPTATGALRCVVDVNDDRMLHFDKVSEEEAKRKGFTGIGRRFKDKRYIFDRVLGMHTTQAEVFESTALKLLDGVLKGYNATVFAYGATGCGKTHTISGSVEDPGIIIRTMRELYRLIDEDKADYETFVELSMVEIYNETIRDLLSDDPAPTGGLKLLENEKERVMIDKVSMHRPQSAEEVMQLVQSGNERRSTSFTQSNSVSSRSHAVLQINVGRNARLHEVDAEQGEVKQATTSATLSIIDLAGSERAAATTNMGARMKEGANINKSLLALGGCINALCMRPGRNGRTHVPYRNSKLTRLLKFSLGGNCRTVMVVCVSPSSRDIEDTHNTLTWADRAKQVVTKVSQNTMTVDARTSQWAKTISMQNEDLKELREEVARLKAGNDRYLEVKRNAQRQEAIQAVHILKGQVMDAMTAVLEGATRRAEWNGVEVIKSVLEKQLEQSEDEDVRRYLEGVKQGLMDKFEGDSSFQYLLSKENSNRETIESLIAGLEKRDFGDAVGKGELGSINLTADALRKAIELQTLRVREEVFSQQLQKQAVSLTLAATTLHELSASIAVQSARASAAASGGASTATMQSIADALQTIADVSGSTLSTLFGEGNGSGLLGALSPPTHRSQPPVASSSAKLPTLGSAPARRSSIATPQAGLGRPAPRPRGSVAPKDTSVSFAGKSAFLASPAARRILPGRAGPAPSAHVASPKKAALRLTNGYKKGGSGGTPRKATKSLRFKGDTSINEIQTFEVLTSQSESSPGGGTDADDSWSSEPSDEQEDAVAALPPPRFMMPGRAARSSLSAPLSGRPRLPQATRLTSPPSASSNSSSSDSEFRSSAGSAPAVPGWKQAREMQKAAMRGNNALSAIGEENVSMMGSEAGPSNRRLSVFGNIGMGPPIRPAPLGERKDNAPAPAPAMSAIPLSGFARPTAASSSKSYNVGDISVQASGIPRSSPTSGTTSGGQAGRRVSMFGPQRPGKDKSHRVSALERKPSVSNLAPIAPSKDFTPIDVMPVPSALSGGAKRAGDFVSSPLAATAGSANMSMGMARPLSHRASISNIGSLSSRTSINPHTGPRPSFAGPRPSVPVWR